MSIKYSILVVNYKDYSSLNRCIELIRKREEQDYEVICFDNTPKEMRQELPAFGNVNMRRIWNNEENGFAKGVNLAAKDAAGDILIFLNPDTEPTGDWLDRMARGLDRYDYVGCTSDYIAGIQSWQWYKDDPREFVDAKLIIPVCAMIRKSTFEEMGGFDERFFLGCEDLDFSWRMNLAGKRMGIATDVFIHHVGHTGYELTPNKAQIIKDMEFKIRAKLKDHYGEKVPTSEELWGCKILATELKPQTLSVAMIAPHSNWVPLWWMNSGKILEEAQVVIHAVGHEMGDFATARNEALEKCTGDWVLWLDTDDEVSKEDWDLINALLKKPGNLTALQAVHFGFKVQNVDKDGNVMDEFCQSRLFPRLPGIKWGGLNGCHGYVHETIAESADAAGLQFVKTNITLKHTGYSDPEVMKGKQARNIRLLEKEPVNSFSLYNFALCYWTLGEYEKAFGYFEQAIPLVNAWEVTFKDHMRYIMAVLIIQGGLERDPVPYLMENTKPDAFFVLGKLLITANDEKVVAQGYDLLFEYLRIGPINDIFGSSWHKFRPEAKEILEKAGKL